MSAADDTYPNEVVYPYADGEVITQRWSPVFVFFAFVVSFTASYSAVRLLDHDLWRTEKEKDHASAIIIKHPKAVAAVLLGFGTVWSMHFVGMAAVTLDRARMCYDWPITLGSLVSAVAFMWVGVIIASRDIFQCQDRLEKLKKIVVSRKNVTAKGRHKEAERTIHLVAFFYKPWYILAGSTMAATGALIMHYTGMEALQGPFQKRWSIPYVSASVVLGVIICAVGFMILFRLLLWKVEKFWLRPASAAVIAIAVCTLHFFGMLGVTYEFDESLVGTCKDRPGYADPEAQVWTTHQLIALAVGIGVPSLALLMENLICRELFHAYAKLKDPALTVEFILEAGTRSRDTNIRRASIMTKKALQRDGRLSAEGNGIEQAAAVAAAADAASAMSSAAPESLPPSRRGSALSAAGTRRRSSAFNSPVPYCTCACGSHARDANRRVSFNTDLMLAAAQDEAGQTAAKRGSAFSGSANSFPEAAINEASEPENIISEASTTENSLAELVAQVRQAAEKRPDSFTLVDVVEDVKAATSLPASLEERLESSPLVSASDNNNNNNNNNNGAVALEKGVSDKWEEDQSSGR